MYIQNGAWDIISELRRQREACVPMLDATGDRYSGSINFKGAGFPAPEPGFAGFSLCKGAVWNGGSPDRGSHFLIGGSRMRPEKSRFCEREEKQWIL